MPKMKTKKAAAKRFKFTGTGKIKYAKANKQHKLTVKTAKRKRGLRKLGVIKKSNVKQIKRMMPYS
jgi:large subunit ribosomal protein L35